MKKVGSEWFNEQECVVTAQTVIEQEKSSWSGLYDAQGKKLIRPEIPVGFELRGKDER